MQRTSLPNLLADIRAQLPALLAAVKVSNPSVVASIENYTNIIDTEITALLAALPRRPEMSQAKTYPLSDSAAIAAKVKAAGGPALDPTQATGQASADGVTLSWSIQPGADSNHDHSKAMDDRV